MGELNKWVKPLYYCCHYSIEPTFGCSIDILAAREHRLVPLFLENLISHIERKGLKVIGLYRLSGNASQVQKLRYLLEESE